MTDMSKYKNVSLTKETYSVLESLSKVLLPDVKLKIYTGQTKVFQCWSCDSEGEYYETEENSNIISDNIPTNKLH